jgi:hypothetical protein
MNNDPEITADQNGKEVEKREQPGERELPAHLAAGRGNETDDQRDQQTDTSDPQKRQHQPVNVSTLKYLSSWNGQMIVAHRSYRVWVVSVFAGCCGAAGGGAFSGFASFSSAAF